MTQKVRFHLFSGEKTSKCLPFVLNEQQQRLMETYFPSTVVFFMPSNQEFCVITLLWLVDGSMKPLTLPYTHTQAGGHKDKKRMIYFWLFHKNNHS